jgi:hypothetical protein
VVVVFLLARINLPRLGVKPSRLIADRRTGGADFRTIQAFRQCGKPAVGSNLKDAVALSPGQARAFQAGFAKPVSFH